MSDFDSNVMEKLKEISLEYLSQTPLGQKICDTVGTIQKFQESICALSSHIEDGKLTLMKMGTILTNGIIAKMLSGKNPKDFTKEDWKDIADRTIEIGVLWDGEKYTLNVFQQYSKYIDFCIEANSRMKTVSERALDRIRELTVELNALNDSFTRGKIQEPDYVERCLWVCFDAMMKFMSAYMTNALPAEYSELIQAISDFSIQYARLKLYKKEQALLEEYFAKQKVLDVELEAKFESYLSEVENCSGQTLDLIHKAFDPNFRYELQNSVELAQRVGVDENDILDSIAKIDDFFA